jgi:hypothetical protein
MSPPVINRINRGRVGATPSPAPQLESSKPAEPDADKPAEAKPDKPAESQPDRPAESEPDKPAELMPIPPGTVELQALPKEPKPQQ